MSDTAPTSEERERVRQAERTVDNLKRLYAVLFALSFGVIATKSFEKLYGYVDPTAAYDWLSFWIHVELTLAFVITAGLFYYQGDRFLDVTYAKAPLKGVAPMSFGVDYLVNVLTMTPFFLMAHSLGIEVVNRFGFFWFFASYGALIFLGLVLLGVREVWHIYWRSQVANEIRALQYFWMIMNSGLFGVILIIYFLLQTVGDQCPVNPAVATWPWAIIPFGLLIFIRDILDYSHGWAILFPVDPSHPSGTKRFAILSLESDRGLAIGRWMGLISIAAVTALLIATDLWNLPNLARACDSSGLGL